MKKIEKMKTWIMSHPFATGVAGIISGISIGGAIYAFGVNTGKKIEDYKFDAGVAQLVTDGYVKLTRPVLEDGEHNYEIINSISEWCKMINEIYKK